MKRLRITVEGKVYDVTVEVLDDGVSAPAPVAAVPVAVPAPVASGGEAVISQLAGSVVGVSVAVGQKVIEGQPLIVIEAMKMNTTVVSPRGGTVRAIDVEVGNAVEEGQTLLTLSA